jgi:hypothetical protein
MRYETIENEIKSMSTAKLNRTLHRMEKSKEPDFIYIDKMKEELRQRQIDKDAEFTSSWFV